MQKVQTKLTSQGQVSVPAAVRNFLHLIPGSVMVWSQDGVCSIPLLVDIKSLLR